MRLNAVVPVAVQVSVAPTPCSARELSCASLNTSDLFRAPLSPADLLLQGS